LVVVLGMSASCREGMQVRASGESGVSWRSFRASVSWTTRSSWGVGGGARW
jgi:hypothetical protein